MQGDPSLKQVVESAFIHELSEGRVRTESRLVVLRGNDLCIVAVSDRPVFVVLADQFKRGVVRNDLPAAKQVKIGRQDVDGR